MSELLRSEGCEILHSVSLHGSINKEGTGADAFRNSANPAEEVETFLAKWETERDAVVAALEDFSRRYRHTIIECMLS
jgi:hypothetical protein